MRSTSVLIGLLLAVVMALFAGCGDATGGEAGPAEGGRTGTDPESGLAWIAESDLPPEGVETLELIDAGGPFPYPGKDGSTRWNASLGAPPCEVGSIRGPTVSRSSMTEPGQPCVMISGNAFSCLDLTWMKWISTPSISVLNCGSAFSLASHLRQSYSVVQ